MKGRSGLWAERAGNVNIAQCLSPAMAGFILGGLAIWALLPIIPCALLAMGRRPYAGLAIACVLEMALLHRHGPIAFLFVIAVWLAWLPGSGYHLGAALALVAVSLLTPSPSTRLASLAGAGVVALVTMVEVIDGEGGKRCANKHE